MIMQRLCEPSEESSSVNEWRMRHSIACRVRDRPSVCVCVEQLGWENVQRQRGKPRHNASAPSDDTHIWWEMLDGSTRQLF
jgi:imidazoleglycerol phosphate synthase glutamine amidotransferase subunit HisH